MICPDALVTSITAAAITLANGKSIDEVGLLAAVFSQLGDTLATIAMQRDRLEDCKESAGRIDRAI